MGIGLKEGVGDGEGVEGCGGGASGVVLTPPNQLGKLFFNLNAV